MLVATTIAKPSSKSSSAAVAEVNDLNFIYSSNYLYKTLIML